MSANKTQRTLAVMDVEDARVDITAHFDEGASSASWYSVTDAETGNLIVDHCMALPTYEQIASAMHQG